MLFLSPASTTASGYSTRFKIPSRESTYEESDGQETEETDQPDTTTTAPPTTPKISRPFSQTRSNLRIFSSVRGSVWHSGSKSKTSMDRHKEPERETTATEEGTNENEAAENSQPEMTNNVPSKTADESKISSGSKKTGTVIKSSEPNTQTSSPKHVSLSSGSLPKVQDHRQSQPSTPRISSTVNRRPSSGSSGSRTRNQTGPSSSLPKIQDSVSSSSSHPEEKISTPGTKSSTQSGQNTQSEKDKELSSSASASSSSFPSSESTSILSASGTSRGSNPATRGRASGSSSVYLNSRRTVSNKGLRQQSGPKTQQTSKDSTVLANKYPDSTSIQDTTHNNHETEENVIQNHSAPYQYTTTRPPVKEQKTTEKYTDTSKDGSSASSPSSSETNSSHTGPLSSSTNRNSRVVMGSRRKDGRVPWSRTSSSLGARSPILRGQDLGDKTKESAPTKAPKQTISDNKLTSSRDPTDNGESKSNSNHEGDFSYEATKETYQISHKNVASTSSPTTSGVKESQRSAQRLGSASQSGHTPLRKAGLSFNEKVRSPLLESRLNELRLRGGLQLSQKTRVGSPSRQASPSSSVISSSTSQRQQASPMNQVTSFNKDTNERLSTESNVRSQLRQQTTSDNSNGANVSTTPARNPVMGSRLHVPSRSSSFSRSKAPIVMPKPTYRQGKLYILHMVQEKMMHNIILLLLFFFSWLK